MADNLANFLCRLSTNSVRPKLLQPYTPAQACNGIALPFLDINMCIFRIKMKNIFGGVETNS